MLSTGALPEGSGTFPTFASVSLVDITASGILVLIIVLLIIRYARLNPSSTRLLGVARSRLGIRGLCRIFVFEIVNRVMLQRDLINEKPRRFAHLCLFWGFIGLSVTTTADYLFNEHGGYIPLFNSNLSWIRILGNVSGLVMMLGASMTIGRIIGVKRYRERTSFSDAWFSVLLLLGGLSGFVTEYLGEIAFSQSPTIPPAALYSISTSASVLIMIPYGAHLLLIALLFISAPVSAFVHALRVPSLRYLDEVGSRLSTEEMLRSASKTGGNLESGSSVPNFHRTIKENVMIDQIKSHYNVEENLDKEKPSHSKKSNDDSESPKS